MELFHRDLGGDGLPPLVILHGILGSSRNWQTAGKDLALAYHVLALDLRNHGGSPHAEEMTYDAMVGDVIAWLEARGPEKVTLLGHSMGGKVAMLLACRQPERVERLVVVDIAPKAYSWGGSERAEFAAMNALDLSHLASRAEAERLLESGVPDWALRKFLTTNLERDADGGWRWAVNLPVLTKALPALEQDSLRPTDHFGGAVQFIIGGKSDYVRASDEIAIFRHFPMARLSQLPRCGHNPHMEARELFVAAVRRS